ncbi:MAG: type II toxin-antitoxin system VapC family toxin [Candidatus Omnitrophica bacterium]|nr:type II toxin-antitoxin system VapC family toxin [Candidatus Omnitrophota bacterium]MCA9442929.1 type II toxin-antitoxin system VapC family toxin [Candidatus Omnitrophota bacterium]
MKFLLDSDTCIRLIRTKRRDLQDSYLRYSPWDGAISTISLFELATGALKSEQPQKSRDVLFRFASRFHILDFDLEAANEAAKIRAGLEKKGAKIGPYDNLIAAIAKSNDLILVTNNTREFKRVKGLKVENWLKS